MKNREKYRDKIVEVIKDDDKMCCFMRDEVLPHFLKDNDCKKIGCNTCAKMFAFWLDEEYKEPEVDWTKVPVDTLVRVRNRAEDKWVLRYFKEIGDEHLNCRYFTWAGGTTSKTAEGNAIAWKYCELVEDEDGNSSI